MKNMPLPLSQRLQSHAETIGQAVAQGQNQEMTPSPESSFRRFQKGEFNVKEKMANAGAQSLRLKFKKKKKKCCTFAGQRNQSNREKKNASE